MRQLVAQTHRHAAIFLPCLVTLPSPVLRVADDAEKPCILSDGPRPNATRAIWVHLLAHVSSAIFATPDGVPHVVPTEIAIHFLRNQSHVIFKQATLSVNMCSGPPFALNHPPVTPAEARSNPSLDSVVVLGYLRF